MRAEQTPSSTSSLTSAPSLPPLHRAQPSTRSRLPSASPPTLTSTPSSASTPSLPQRTTSSSPSSRYSSTTALLSTRHGCRATLTPSPSMVCTASLPMCATQNTERDSLRQSSRAHNWSTRSASLPSRRSASRTSAATSPTRRSRPHCRSSLRRSSPGSSMVCTTFSYDPI